MRLTLLVCRRLLSGPAFGCYALLLIWAAVFFLYSPFAGSPVVFDDHAIISNNSVYDHASNLFSSAARSFPYFSVGFVHVISAGDLSWNRYLNIALHGAVVLALYFFLLRAISRTTNGQPGLARSVAVMVCLWVALNPVAVYATAYLIQRTIVFACLFGLISATLYLRAQQKNRNADVFSAALFAGLSVMSKEHAVFLPCAVLALTPLVCDWNRASLLRALGYFFLSLPCSIWAVLNNAKGIVGTSYEIYSGQVISQFSRPGLFDFPGGDWVMSMATQLLLFWNYLFLWFVPNPQWLSADMRVDFPVLWSSWWPILGVIGSLLVFAAALIFWFRSSAQSRVRPLSAALLFAAIPFVVELSVVRVQEPFVLYRSFLWMPAYALLCSLLFIWMDSWLSRHGVLVRRGAWALTLLACLALFPMATNRLQSLSSEETLWQDALQKLPRPDVAGSDRIYYNLAGAAFKRKDFVEALRFSEWVVKQNPAAFQGYLARGTTLLAMDRLDEASADFDRADAHHPPKKFTGYIEFKRCAILLRRKETSQAIDCMRRSATMGYEPANFALQILNLNE